MEGQQIQNRVKHVPKVFCVGKCCNWPRCRHCQGLQTGMNEIKPCKCGLIHETCLQEVIQKSAKITSKYEGYQEYKCPDCSSTILFREGFKREKVASSELTCTETAMIVFFVLTILGGIGLIVAGFYVHALAGSIVKWTTGGINIIMGSFGLFKYTTCKFFYIEEESSVNPETDRDLVKT